MVAFTKYHAIAGFILFLLLIVVTQIPLEKTVYEDFENITNITDNPSGITSEKTLLMSTTDNTPAEEVVGWWKHTGHSTVSSKTTRDEFNNDKNTDNDSDDGTEKENHEIPEFSTIILPVFIIISIALFSRK
ncbi:hypothetical protein [Methanolobus psychrotolerans]|uniref:hypothetical protein n=1 Tax=Methanolobus psychrotolerans TaxID=1874706 RepID=UPI000B918408|nr:hypothetical protein [Methanolobus psychrotolerans]